MMRWIVGTSLRFRFLAVFIPLALMAYGIVQIRTMPVDVFPEFAPPRVRLQTAAIGLTAVEVEELITVPIEDTMNGIVGLDVIRSKSVPQLSEITMIFEPGQDLIEARQLVQERLALVIPTLPRWAAPPVIVQPLSSTSRVMKIGLTSEEHSLIEMSMTSYWHIRQRLLTVPGVANVAIWGERLQMLQVQVDPSDLETLDVPLDLVMKVTADALDSGLLAYSNGALVGTGGFVDTRDTRYGIRFTQPIRTPADLAKVAVAERDGTVLRLGDVANVIEDHQPLIGDAIINSGPGLMLIVEKFPWGNTLEVTHGVEEALDELKPGLQGVEIDSEIFRPASFIETSLSNLQQAMLIGAILVVLVLGVFLFEWRVAVISVIAIPLSLVAAGLVLYVRDATINVMVLAGFIIALGAVVDDAIIDVENIVRRLRQHRREGSTKSTAAIVLDASIEVRSAIVFATLIEVTALIPVFFLEGLSGAFFRPLAESYALAILASMGVALVVTPALSLILLRNATLEQRESPLLPWLKRGYRRLLLPIVRSPRPAYGAVGVLAIAGLLVVPTLGQELLPSFKERDFLMHWLTRPGTSQPEMARITTQASKELLAIPGVNHFGAHIGQALVADEVVGIYFGENWVSVDPSVDYDETVKAIQATVDGYPGLYHDVQTYLKERIREVLTGHGDSIVIRVNGPNTQVLRTIADDLEERLQNVEGLTDLHVSLQTPVPQIDVQVNEAAASRYGMKPGDVRRLAATLVGGEEVGDIFRDGRAYDVVVWGQPQVRASVSDIRNLLLDTPTGDHVRLHEIADVTVEPAVNVIERENASRQIDVSANPEGRDLGSVVDDVREVIDSYDFPLRYSASVLGEFAERQATQQRLIRLAVLAAVGIFLLLLTSFGSWRLAILGAVTLPSALVGGVLAAYFTGGVLSLGSLVGFLTVLGIAARNGIMLINHFQHLEDEEGVPFGRDLVLRGADERLAPILMTALTTGLALLPLIIAGKVAGHEIEHPMAIVILGGLVTSTALNLFIVPSLYLRWGQTGRVDRRVVGI